MLLIDLSNHQLFLEPPIARSFLLAAILAVFLVTTVLADERGDGGQDIAAQNGTRRSEMVFDIPAQPLAAALDAYSAATNKDVFYDGSAAMDRRSAAVKGLFTPETALKTLLDGTELAILPSGENGYTIISPPRALVPAATTTAPTDERYRHYFALIQANIRTALCRNPETRPGPYRLIVKFWIGPAGLVQHSEVIGSTGDQARDGLFAQTVRQLQFEESPPADLPQPITVAIFPQTQSQSKACVGSADNQVAP